MPSTVPWQIWVDTGGTFTDCLALAPDGTKRRAKVLSNSALRGIVVGQDSSNSLRIQENWAAPENFPCGFAFRVLTGTVTESDPPITIRGYDPVRGQLTLSQSVQVAAGSAFELRSPEEVPLLAARLVTGTPADAPMPPIALRLATTRGTNALLTQTGTQPALFITRGFGDLLEIGTQQRPDLFALDIVKPVPLYGTVIEVDERLNADGSVRYPLEEERIRTKIAQLSGRGITTAAVALLHSAINPFHERRLAELLRDAGFTHVSLSSDLAPFIKILPRAETAVVNAYLAPVIGRYVGRVLAGSGNPDPANTLHLMTSTGGLVGVGAFQPKDSLLSGPAGGIVGAALSGREAGFDRVIAFDMGGTSTDVARYNGDFEYIFEHGVGDAHLVAPALAIESVAAGGGSICVAGRQGLRVGPESAGANPGPACYGAGGPLTITDINLLLGRILPNRFEIPLRRDRAEEAAERLMRSLAVETSSTTERDTIFEGLLEIANERMAVAIRRISVRKGYDPSDYALVSFGGAGGQHACAVASRLGMRTVVIPRDASLLSAWGIGHAVIERFAERQLLQSLEEFGEEALAGLLETLVTEAQEALQSEGVMPEHAVVRRRIIALRLMGQESSLVLEYDREVLLSELFAARYEAVYGHRPPGNRVIEIESVRVVVSEQEREMVPFAWSQADGEAEAVTVPTQTRSRFNGEWIETSVHERDSLVVGQEIHGPSLIVEQHSILVVEPGWMATVNRDSGAIILIASRPGNGTEKAGNGMGGETVTEELFASRFTAIAEEMGEMLQRTALSVNVKERLDFSCALLNRSGDLIASAAHIPVHLGALGACVRRLRESVTMGPQDTVVVNHPAFGGSHLPDVTVVTPVFDAGERLLGYVANRAHHAEIGGTRPGSMPPDATTLAEEGVVLPPTFLTRNDGSGGMVSRLDEVCQLLADAPYPSRAIADNRADLEAALAANRRGAESLRALASTHGADVVGSYMDALTTRAERLLRQALLEKRDGIYRATEYLDDGIPIVVTITIAGDSATIDFTGTGATHPGNLNAPPSVVASAILYILRLLVGEPLPLNEGLLRPVRLILPADTLVNPTFDPTDPTRCPAVVGGNTETSQRIVGALLKALELSASSQGTMNNVLFGNAAFGYYETVCGGAGATKNAPGASAVHTHMTNTRITDVELLERRYPVRVERFGIRRGSGGIGLHSGGDGAVREFTFLEPVSLSLLTQHRVQGPFGLAGGEPGKPGHQTLFRATGEAEELPSIGGAEVQPGDRLLLETPGGGGFGEPV